MNIFLTGSTGFVGKQILKDLLNREHRVRCLVRKGSESKISQYKDGVEMVDGDITNARSLEGKLKGCDAVINLVGIIREYPIKGITFKKMHYEGTVNLANAARSQGVNRFIQMSALGARAHGKTRYHLTKFHAEEYIRSARLDYTIFRPSIIFGMEDKFVNMFAKMLRTQQFVPVVGNGKYQMQPVSVENVSLGFVKSVEKSDAIGKIFEIGGPEKISLNQLINIVAEALCVPPHKLHIPAFIMNTMAEMFDWLPFFPVTKEQITMFMEGNTCDERPFFQYFDIQPVGFKEGILKYIR